VAKFVSVLGGRARELVFGDGEDVCIVLFVSKDVLGVLDSLLRMVKDEVRDVAYVRVKEVVPNFDCLKKAVEGCGFIDELYGIGVIDCKCMDKVKKCNTRVYYLGVTKGLRVPVP